MFAHHLDLGKKNFLNNYQIASFTANLMFGRRGLAVL